MTVQPGPAPLLIACALGIENLALRGGGHAVRRGAAPMSRDRGGPSARATSTVGERQDPGAAGAEHAHASGAGIQRPAAEPDNWGADGPITVLRTGMGPRAAERSVTRALGDPAFAQAAVVASGFCAGLAPGMHPGDLVVAEETRDPRGTTACEGVELLVKELARAVPGRTVHTGPLTGSDHVVRGQERSQLRATGAIAVDMESAATLFSAVRAGARPVAAVRVVVDAPEHELVRIGTVRGGISAFRVLRSVPPVFFEWHRSLSLPRR